MPDGLNHNYHKYVVRFQNKEVRDRVKERLGASVHYPRPISENKMYQNIEHRKDDLFITKTVCDTILTLPIHPYMKKSEVDKVINSILILLEQENNRFVDDMKRILGDDMIDKSLINELDKTEQTKFGFFLISDITSLKFFIRPGSPPSKFTLTL